MKKKRVVFSVLLTIMNQALCMEQKQIISIVTHTELVRNAYKDDLKQLTRKNHEKLQKTLEKRIKEVTLILNDGSKNSMVYNTVRGDMQYDLLWSFITHNDMQALSICLECKFNPNRYHKKLSLLHFAVKKNRPGAITILSQYNPDLIPFNQKLQTPLDYAIALNRTECITAMVHAIEHKIRELSIFQKHCQLTKHILNPGPCTQCLESLIWQLKFHSIFKTSTLVKQLTSSSSYISSNSNADSDVALSS